MQRQTTRVTSPNASVTSNASSIIRRKKQVELETARKKAELDAADRQAQVNADIATREAQRKLLDLEAEIEKDIIDEGSNQDLDEDDFISVEDDNPDIPDPEGERKVESWVNQVDFKNNQPDVASGSNVEALARIFSQAIGTAIEASKDPTPKAPFNFKYRKPSDLPIFYGNPMDWPLFISQFRMTTKTDNVSQEDNTYRLQRCLKGKALEAVKAMLLVPGNVELVITTLERHYGRPDLIVDTLIKRVKDIQPCKDGRPDMLIDLSDAVNNLVITMENMKCEKYMCSPEIHREVVRKLAPQYQVQWCEAFGPDEKPDLKDLAKWLGERADRAAIHAHTFKREEPHTKPDDRRERRTTRVLTAVDDEEPSELSNPNKKPNQKRGNKCGFCYKVGHKINVCRQFLKLSVQQRWDVVKKEHACFNCLEFGHGSEACVQEKCPSESCGRPHHKLLHEERRPFQKKEPEVATVLIQSSSPTDEVLLSVIPVTVFGPAGEISTHALLDSGAKHTFIDSSVADKIGITGPRKSMRVLGFSARVTMDHDARRVKFQLKGPGMQTFCMKNVVSMKGLDLPTQSVDIEKLKKNWKYLDGIPLCSMKNVKPTLLIGQNDYDLFVPRKIIEGDENGPIATETLLGWVIQGRTSTRQAENSVVLHACIEEDDSLHQMVKESFQTESFGVRLIDKPKRSVEDTRALKLMEDFTKQAKQVTEATDYWMKVEDTLPQPTARWETCLPWKSDSPELPRSKPMAFSRLKSVERKMDKNPPFGEEYCQKIQTYIEKGFARKLTPTEASTDGPTTWYLPHFDVHNPNKPGKWRLVFDAASKCQGVSLNDKLIQGPDLLNPLPVVLFKFRQKKVAFTADIKDFFHRILIRPEDSCAQRFLWRGMDRDRPPDVMEMSVMVFGAVSSPFCAQFVRNKNAERFTKDFPEAVDGIVNKHYIDDYLDCADSVEEAVRLINQVVTIHRKGGFQIIGWTCSSKDVLDQLPAELKSDQQKDLEPDTLLPMARVLGLHWNPNQDAFTFICKFNKVNDEIVNGNKRPTKREMLKLVMSVFDPLGFLAHFTVKARILLQEVWRSEIGWDDEITTDLFKKWCLWLQELKNIPEVRIPRCYSLELNQASNVQLHLFCDASEKAFSAVAYLRVETGNKIDVTFVMAKTRVAPLKAISIPRMELQAAVMATRLCKTIQEGHEIKINDYRFWSDSKTVLCWLRSDSRNFKPFVSHRVGEIQEGSEVSQWSWIPTAENVADDATRDGLPCEFGANSRWVNGPSFLKLPKEDWPREKNNSESEVNEDDLEKKNEIPCLVVTEMPDALPDISRFSSWLRLIRSTAWILRYIGNCEKKPLQSATEKVRRSERNKIVTTQTRNLTELLPQEYETAEKLWWKKCQFESFPEEIKSLKNGKPIHPSSRLATLSPYLEDGVLRIKGRTDLGNIPESVKRPVILDPKHPFTRLLVQHYHKKANHNGQEYVVNELRQKYWILNIRVTVRSIWNACRICEIRRAKPKTPEMGQLPEFRLVRSLRPFETTGVDYFGPMEVTIGRRHEKRYGALFTCLTTRAIHLELADSLTTDSAIMAYRRFMSQRGCPKKMYSDNGTNFHGAATELKKALMEIDWTKVQAEFGSRGTEWMFIPPAAPHMGGCWERLVRSVKVALSVTLKEKIPKEEVLRTLLAEAANIINSRPLTHVSVDPADKESLTPNHFLIGSSNGEPAPGKFSDADLCLRQQWRISQRLADMFWQRWVREYLPTLTRRTKWFKQTKPLKIGDLVLIADGNLPRNVWPRGLVVKVFYGPDGKVRVAEVKTQFGVYKRPVAKLCVLDVLTVDSPTLPNSAQEKVEKV